MKRDRSLAHSSVSPNRPATVEGREYLDSLSVTERRNSGRVYTPAYLVRFILDAAGYVGDAEIEAVPLLDPACGAGVFLEEALHRLAARISAMHGALSFQAATDAFLSSARNTLFGIDVDPDACALARTAMARTAAELTGRPVSLDYFATNVIEADFLNGDLLKQGGRLAALPRFGAVVGNPPYVAATRLNPAAKGELRRNFRTASGRIDLYLLFFERGTALLRPGGRLAFITPDKYLSSQSARPLRELLRGSGAIRTLARFDSHKVFADAATVPCVTVLQRGASQESVELLRCAPDEYASDSVRILSRSTLSPSVVAGNDWSAVRPAVQRLAARIRGMHPTLDGLSRRVSAGLATGRDGVFVIRPGTAHEIEPELLHKAVRGRDVSRFQIDDPELLILVPYDFSGKAPALVDIRRYPGARRYLSAYREELELRHAARVWGKSWYDLHDPVPLDLGKHPKILVPDVADRNRFAFDLGAYVPLHSAYYILPDGVDARFLTALLNSRPIEFLIRTIAPRIKDGFSRYRSQFLLGLPIPAPESRVVHQIGLAHDRGDFDSAADRAGQLFGLTPRENAAIDRTLADLRAKV